MSFFLKKIFTFGDNFIIEITMKKTALLWIVMLIAMCNLMGQVNLIDVVKPSDSKRYEPYPADGKKTMKLAAYDYSNGFVLST